MEYPPELVHGFLGVVKYPSFMLTNFSSKTMFAVFITYCLYDQWAFQVFQEQLVFYNHLKASFLYRIIRTTLVILMGSIWYFKTEQRMPSAKSGLAVTVAPHMLNIQAVCVLLMSAVLVAPVLFDVFLIHPDSLGLSAHVLLSLTGLKLVAPLSFFVIRDTPADAFIITWIVGIITTFACCFQTQDKEQMITLFLYVITTFIIFRDNFQRNKMMRDTVTKLENTLKENEQLAVDAQALELRAMIGNVAHDLKTVRCCA